MEINITPHISLTSEKEWNQNRSMIRLGIVGCGYVTTMSHLPATQQSHEFQVTGLVDLRPDLSSPLAELYQVPVVSTDYRDLFDKVDAVIVAVPHEMHAPVAIDFLSRGIHVLVEKPMATSVEECQLMIQAAKSSGAKLAVGLMRRFYDNSQLVKRMIDSGLLGRVRQFDAQEVVLFDHFKASPFSVQPPYGGVLFDTGPHTLDLLLWWFGDFARLNYWDDARGGVEANCKIEIETTQGVAGVVELSRTRRLENTIKIECERGCIKYSTLNPDRITIESEFLSGPIQTVKVIEENDGPVLLPYFIRQLKNFAGAISRDETLEVSGEEGMRSIEIIEQCKRTRQPFDLQPWEEINQQVIERIDP